MSPLLYWAIVAALLTLVLAMGLAAVRIFKGPSAQDRGLPLYALYI